MDIHNYDKMDILRKCWGGVEICEQMHFLVYDHEKIIKALSYCDILMNRQVANNSIRFSKNIFKDALNYFLTLEDKSYSYIPVLDENDNCMFLLEYTPNDFSDSTRKIHNKNFFYYDFDNNLEYLDLTLLNEKDGYVFFELEEYTFAITMLILKIYPGKKIVFLDKKAQYFFDNSEIIFCGSFFEFEKIFSTNSWLFVHSNKNQIRREIIPQFLTGIYCSINIMESLLWCTNRRCYGDLNPDKTILVLDGNWNDAGLVDFMKCTCEYVLLANERGWIPIIDYSNYPNQYLKYPGENMWDYYFCPVSDITVEEAYASKNVIRLSDNFTVMNAVITNPYLHKKEDLLWSEVNENKNMFSNIIRLNKETTELIKMKIPKEFYVSDYKILGVIMRGTDYRDKSVISRKSVPRNSDISSVILKVIEIMNIWGFKYIFLATEDNNYYKEFQEKFTGKILSIDQKRVNNKEDNGKYVFVSKLLNVNGDDNFVNSYIASLYCLSICQGLVASVACGATFAACSWNHGKYEVCEIMGK